MSGIDLTLLPGGGFVAIAADVVSGHDLHAAMFDCPSSRRIRRRDWQVILRRRRGDLLLYWRARQRGDNRPGWRREVLADLRRARAGLRRAEAAVAAIPADFPGRTR
jgi:hypothetical protein